MTTTQTIFNSPQQLQDYLLNPKNYKPVRKKSHTIWCCMPVVGTRVNNRLEDESYVTSEQRRFVLSGTRGELTVVDAAELAKGYYFEGGIPITPQSLQLKRDMKEKDGVMDWFKVEAIADNKATLWATFVPFNYHFQINPKYGAPLSGNRVGIPHGKGDFVFCSDSNGQPNVYDRWIVNGETFANMYDNRGWSDCIDTATVVNGILPKPTIEVVPPQSGEQALRFVFAPLLKKDSEGVDYALKNIAEAKKTAGDIMRGLSLKYSCNFAVLQKAVKALHAYREEMCKRVDAMWGRCNIGMSSFVTAEFNTTLRFFSYLHTKGNPKDTFYCIEDAFTYDPDHEEVGWCCICFPVDDEERGKYMSETEIELDFDWMVKAVKRSNGNTDVVDSLANTALVRSISVLATQVHKIPEVAAVVYPNKLPEAHSSGNGVEEAALQTLFKDFVAKENISLRKDNGIPVQDSIRDALAALGNTGGSQDALVRLLCKSRKDIIEGLTVELGFESNRYAKYIPKFESFLKNPKFCSFIDDAVVENRGVRLLLCWNDLTEVISFNIQDSLTLNNPHTSCFYCRDEKGGVDDSVILQTNITFLKELLAKRATGDESYKKEYATAIHADVAKCMKAIQQLETCCD